MVFLENEHIKVSFTKKGAELRSVLNKINNSDYLWNGNPAYWGKFSPVLFPIVGALKNNTYYYKNEKYQLSRHGFARDFEFEVDQPGIENIIFTLSHNEETLKIYPFQFRLQIKYKLTGSGLSCTYQVSNPDQQTLLFSIGAHPAFKVPLQRGLEYTDYFLEFNNDDTLSYHKIDHDLIANETVEIELKDKKLPLRHELFYDDALVFKSLKSDCISIRSQKSPNGLHFKFKDFPFFGIWSAKDADFLCLEPWCGIADGLHRTQKLEEKEGIIPLAPGEIWSRTWEIACF